MYCIPITPPSFTHTEKNMSVSLPIHYIAKTTYLQGSGSLVRVRHCWTHPNDGQAFLDSPTWLESLAMLDPLFIV